MAFSGERINGLQPKGYKFFRERDKEENQRLAKEQAEAGASCLDLNAGTAWLRPAEVMVYPVKTVPKVMDTPLSPLDGRLLDVVAAGLQACLRPVLIDSATGEKNGGGNPLALDGGAPRKNAGKNLRDAGATPHGSRSNSD
jgi:5-methyltetrahydrofolate--homocysteine methyltransferase